MRNHTQKELQAGFIAVMLIMSAGTAGYVIIEDMSILDAFYMTVITISTTGYREVAPLHPAGKIFTSFIIITGVAALAYLGGKAAQMILEKTILRRKKMSRMVNSLNGHYIVCGYGRMGQAICEGLKENNVEFVVIENSEEKIEMIEEKGYLTVQGDCTSDDVLINAGLKRAKGLVAVVRTDAENVFAALSAKGLNPDIFVVSRAIEEGTESKLIKAGADRVVKPYELGGSRMVQLLLRPGVTDFIDGVARQRNVNIQLEEIKVSDNSTLAGTSLMDSTIRKDLNIIIVAFYKANGSFLYNPVSSTEIQAGDKLIAIGETENLEKLYLLCNPSSK